MEVAITVSILLVALSYGKTVKNQNDYHKQSLVCARQNTNYQYFTSYSTCMLYYGYDITPITQN
jgi:hypothetical protein